MTDRYQILEQLGEGGVGSVYKAWDAKLQRHVAIKFLLPANQRTSEQGTDLSREAAAIARLQHPNVVSVYDLDSDGDAPMVVMEFINGETLEQMTRRGAMDQEDWEKIAQESLEGLAAAHAAGMVHRDIKPGNMMFHWLTNGDYQIKLLDFGLANQGMRPEQQDLTESGTVAGSVHFMAPEQFQRHPLDVRTDLYSMGAVLYYSLAGRLPFDGESTDAVMNAHLKHTCPALSTVRPDLSPLLAEWVNWLIKRQPSDRPESAALALKTLRGIISGTLTEIPGRRTTALKTVADVPLLRDAANRTSHQSASSSVPAPGVVVAATPEAKPALPAAVLLSAAAALAAGGILWGVLKKPSTPEPDPPTIVPATSVIEHTPIPPPTAAPPLVSDPIPALPDLPLEHLVICLHAGSGGKKNRGADPIAAGDAADYWPDTASALGDNGAQYFVTAQADRELHQPLWVPVPDGEGLVDSQMAYSFAPERNFVMARDRDMVGDPVGDAFSGNARTWMIVMKAPGNLPVDQIVIQSRVGENSRGWETRIDEGNIRSGGHTDHDNQSYHSKCDFPGSSWFILAARYDGAAKRLRQWIVQPDGKLLACDPVFADLATGDAEYIRIGSGKMSNEPVHDYFQGSIACILIYNAALPDAGVNKCLSVLCSRFFSKALAE